MKRFLPILILIIIPLSLLIAKPAEAYVAQPGDSLWSLAENRVPTKDIMVINAIKNLEIMLNNLDNTNYYLEIGQDYKLLTPSQINFLTNQSNTVYLIANPTPNPVWQELRITAQSLSPTIVISPFPSNIPTPEEINVPADLPVPETIPQVQGAHTSIIPLADSPFPY